ncbi:hypothetical protein, partial [Methylocystis sp. Sn-Cys]|uniref:hypothetical protein n=1 Tax=Methylocystis sp. Sn-Cys TaxID=1701263 RepID=UPI001AED2250
MAFQNFSGAICGACVVILTAPGFLALTYEARILHDDEAFALWLIYGAPSGIARKSYPPVDPKRTGAFGDHATKVRKFFERALTPRGSIRITHSSTAALPTVAADAV